MFYSLNSWGIEISLCWCTVLLNFRLIFYKILQKKKYVKVHARSKATLRKQNKNSVKFDHLALTDSL